MRKTSEERCIEDGSRARYEVVMDSLTAKDRARIERLRTSETQHGYGHDLLAAISRGHRNRAVRAAHVVMDEAALGAAYGQDHSREYKPQLRFAFALDQLIRAAAEEGAPADEMRRVLRSNADTTDGTSLEEVVKRASEGR